MVVPTPCAQQRDGVRVTNELRGWERGLAEPGWGSEGNAEPQDPSCASKGDARGRGAQGRASGRPSRGAGGLGVGELPLCSSAERERGCGAGGSAGAPTGNAAVPGRGWRHRHRHRAEKLSPSPPQARSVRPSIPRARGELLPVPPARPEVPTLPAPAAPRCAPSPGLLPARRCGALGAYLRALSGAARCCGAAGAVRGCPAGCGRGAPAVWAGLGGRTQRMGTGRRH